MYYTVKIDSVFMSMKQREDQPWRRDIIAGVRDGTGRHMHLALSGAITSEFHETWFAHDVDSNVIVEAGGFAVDNAPKLLLDCIPSTLREFQHPGQPLSWNVGSLDSFFLSQRKFLQQ